MILYLGLTACIIYKRYFFFKTLLKLWQWYILTCWQPGWAFLYTLNRMFLPWSSVEAVSSLVTEFKFKRCGTMWYSRIGLTFSGLDSMEYTMSCGRVLTASSVGAKTVYTPENWNRFAVRVGYQSNESLAWNFVYSMQDGSLAASH